MLWSSCSGGTEHSPQLGSRGCGGACAARAAGAPVRRTAGACGELRRTHGCDPQPRNTRERRTQDPVRRRWLRCQRQRQSYCGRAHGRPGQGQGQPLAMYPKRAPATHTALLHHVAATLSAWQATRCTGLPLHEQHRSGLMTRCIVPSSNP